MIELTDTHCHIQEIGLPGAGMWPDGHDAEELVERAAKNGVTRLICVGTDVANSKAAVDFAASHPSCWASIGVHPHDTKGADLGALAPLAVKPKVVAVGEIGLDYFYNHSPKDDQIRALKAQIELALEHNLPIIFHVRQAFDDFWPIFDSYKNIRGVLHSFTDNRDNFEKAMERGLYIGINGITTFTKDQNQLQIAKEVPLQKLLLETDSPFLTPVPLRGTVNEPAHVRLVAEFLAGLRGQTIEDLAASTTHNAQTLFSL